MPEMCAKMYQTIWYVLLFYPLRVTICLVLQTRRWRLEEVKASSRGPVVSGGAATQTQSLQLLYYIILALNNKEAVLRVGIGKEYSKRLSFESGLCHPKALDLWKVISIL